MGRGRGEQIKRGAEAASLRFLFRGQLFGGPGGGMTVRLPRLEDRIKVFRNGGPAFGLAVGEPDPTHAELVGIYELVGPVGPETPIYIPARGV